jgi:hypothetical protein
MTDYYFGICTYIGTGSRVFHVYGLMTDYYYGNYISPTIVTILTES